MHTPRRLLIVSHVVHYRLNGRLYAYGPYAREIDVWAQLFPSVAIAAPVRETEPPGDCLPLREANVTLRPMLEMGGDGLAAKIALVWKGPVAAFQLCRAMRASDAVHVRCPGNLGLLGVLVAPLCSRRMVAKYAGQWSTYPGEAWTYRLQRVLLRSSWWRGPVTVYGHWPGMPEHVVPFFTSVLDREQMNRAQRAARRRRNGRTLRILYAGRLSAGKNVDVLLEALARLERQGLPVTCDIVGDGPARMGLELQVARLRLACARFAGGVRFEQMLRLYEKADVLVLASETEGWPKAIAEGMAFGLVCIGSNRGLMPEMLARGRGIVVPPRDAEALARALRDIALRPYRYQAARGRAAAWAQRFTLEGLREALRDLLARTWTAPAGVPC